MTHEPDADVIEVGIPADVVYVATLRLTAASLAARCDLTVDDIEDLRLAVDEACALLLPLAAPGTPLKATFGVAPGRLSVQTSVSTGAGAEPDRSGFAWTVLGALASSVDVAQDTGSLTIGIVKSREAASA